MLLDMFYPVFVSVLIQLRKQAFEHLLHIADDGSVHHDVFVDLCGIHIDLKNLWHSRANLDDLSNHTVAETGADDDQQITVCHTEVGSLCAMHTDHAAVELVSAVEMRLFPSGCRPRER